MRIPSGVPGFDALVQGGIPAGAAVVVQGPAGREKDTFLFQFVVEGVRGGGSALVVLSSVSPAKYMRELQEAGVDVDRAVAENRLKFVDWFTYKENPVQDVEQDGPVFRASIDLANVGIAISRAIAALHREGDRRAAVEVLSPALSTYDLSAVYGFAQGTKAKLERSGFTSLFVLEKAMHDERTTSSIHQPFDGVVDIERVREGDEIVRKLAVLSLRETAAASKYVPFEVGEDRVLHVPSDPLSERIQPPPDEPINWNPKDPELWLAAARNLREMGDTKRALRCVEAALKIASDNPKAQRLRGEILEDLAREAVEKAPARAAGPQVSVARERREDPSARVRALIEQRFRDDPNDADALFASAAVRARANDLSGALAILDKLAEIDETYPGLFILKTQMHAKRGELQKAEESIARRLEIEKRLSGLTSTRASVVSRPPPPTQPLQFCSTCGSSVREEDKDCPSCGFAFSGRTTPPAPRFISELTREPQATASPPPPRQPKPEFQPPLPAPPRTRALPTKDPAPRPVSHISLPREVAGSGKTNGLVKRADLARGRTNGLVNGLSGRTNGLVNGTKGRTNGLVNGLRGRTNGLVNGLRSVRLGITNGLTNASGFTNGLGLARFAQDSKSHRWKVYVIPLLTAAMLLLPILMSESPSGSAGITIDGDASDWDSARLATFGRSPGTNPDVDIARAGVVADAYSLTFFIEVDGAMLRGGGSPATTDRFHVFLDTDRDPTTGYSIDSLGAEALVDVSGHGGTVQDASVYNWKAGTESLDWRGWVRSGSAAAAAAGKGLELRMEWGSVVSDPSFPVVAMHGRSFDGTVDTSDGVLNAAGGSLEILQEPVVAEIVRAPAAVVLLRLDVIAFGGESALTGLDVTLTGSANLTAVSALRLVDGAGGLIDQRIPTSSEIGFRFASRGIVPSSPQHFFVIADVLPSDGATVGAIIADAAHVVANAPVSVRRAPSVREVSYLFPAPAAPRVDGGFSEWQGLVPDLQNETSHQEVDLTAFDAQFAGNASFFYAAMDGRALSGTWVPEGNRAVYQRNDRGPDTDGDTVPDVSDLFPYDFNNDLVPDADSGGDIDTDGLVDYGQAGGTDWWLNTTIPASFPPPYSNRTVSAFIGPWEPPFRTRDDILRVFVDIDDTVWTGYAIAGLGADRLIEISGTEGRLRNGDYLTFAGSYPGQWSWIPLSPATVAIGFSRMEFSVPQNLAGNGARWFVEAQGPLGTRDDLTGTRGAARSDSAPAGVASSFDAAPSALLDAWRSGLPPATRANTLLDAHSHTVTSRYNQQRKVVRAGDVSGDTACDASNSDGCWYTVYHDRAGSIESDFKDGTTVAVPTTVGLLDSLVTDRAMGDNLIVAVVQFDNTGSVVRTISAGNLELRRGTTTTDPLVAETQFVVKVPASGGTGDGLFAVLVGKDASAPGISTYGIFGAADATGLNAEVKMVMISGLSSSNSVFADGDSVALSTSATVLTSQSTTFPAASSSLPNIVVAAVQVDETSGQVDIDTPTGIEVRRDSTSLRGIEYKFTITDSSSSPDGVFAIIVAADTAAGASPTYDVRAVNANGASSTANGEAKLLVFRGLAATDTDTGSVSITTSRTVLGTRTTTFAAGDDVILGSIQINSPSPSRTYAAAVNDIRLTGGGSGSNNAFAHTIGPLGGDLQVDMGSFTSPQGSGSTVTVTTGFQPKVFFLWTNGRDSATDTVGADEHIRGFGVGVSLTDRRAVCTQSQDPSTDANGGVVADSGVYHTVDATLCVLDDQGGTDHFDGQLEYDAILSNGFRLIVDPNMDEFFDSGAVRVHYLALGGADIANVVTGEFTEPGATGDQNVTSVGFQPDAVVLFSGMISSAAPAQGDDSTMSVGFAAGSGNPNDVVLAGASNNAADPMQTVSYSLAGESIALFDAAIGGTNGRAEVDAWLSNGFSLNWNQRAGSRRIFYAALQGGRHAVGDLLTSTTTTQFSETGLAFAPAAGLFMSHNKAQSTAATVQDHDEWSMGSVTTATNRRSSCLTDEDALATASVQTAVEHDELYCNVNTADAIEGLMDVVSVNSDGWTLVMDDPDPAQSFVGYWAMAAGPATGASMWEAFVRKVSTGSANPSYEGAAQAPSTGSSGELKLVAIHIKDSGKDGDDRIIMRRSSDTSGSTWGSQVILASGNSGDSPLLYSFDSGEPSIAIDVTGYLHVVWVSASSSGDQSTLNRVRYTKTTVTFPTQSELASAGNWEAVTTVDDASTGYMPTISTDSSNNPHIAWSGSKTSGAIYAKNKAAGTWRSTVSWASSYTSVSVDVAPANDFVALARSYATPEAVVGYRSTSGGGVNVPQTRTWDGSAWGSETSQSTSGSPIWEVEVAWSPTVANTYIMVTLSDDGWLDAYVCTPSCSVTNNIGRVWTSAPTNPRTIFDVAYEQASGEALLAYGVVSTNVAQDVAYKTYTSSGWGSEQYLNDTDSLNNDISYTEIRLASKAGSDAIGMIGADATNADANAWIWDGSSFGNFQEITATAVTDSEQVAVAFERSSGHLLAVSGIASSSNLAWAEYTTGWSTPTTINCANDNVGYAILRPNPVPTANDIILATSDSFSTQLNLHTCYWDGSTFASKVNQDGGIDTEFERPFDFAWESSGSKGLLVYGTTSGQLTYKTFTAPSTWGTATDVAYGSNTKRWVQARTNPLPVTGGTKILGAVMENGDNDLGAFSWDGTTLTVIGDTTFTADHGDGSAEKKESFGLEYNPLGHEVQHTVCKNLSSSLCDASSEFTKWDGSAGYDIVSFEERGGYPSLATTFESNGDLWIAYAKDVDGTTKAIYAKFLDYPSGGWGSAETVEKISGVLLTRPSIGLDKHNVAHALYVRTDGPKLYYRNRDAGSWGADTAAATETLTLGSRVAGSFPTDITFQDSTYIQYRENADEIAAVGYKSNTGIGVNTPKQLDWTGTAWGTPETELATAGAAVENVRVVWDTATDSTLFWILVNTGANIHSYKCTNVDTCSKEDVDPSSGNDYAVTQTVGTAPERHWDATIEASTGELFLVYDNPAVVADDFCYRTRSSGGSGSWSSETCFSHASVATSNPSFAYIGLANNPGSSRIAFGAFDSTNDDFVIGTWDGSAWLTGAHQAACSTAVTLTNGWGGSVYPEDSADEFVAYCGAAVDSVRECEWTNSGGWEATTGCASFDPEATTSTDSKVFSEGGWREGSNSVLLCASNDNADLVCWEWSGVSGTGGSRQGLLEVTTNDGSSTVIALPAGVDWSPDQTGTADGLLVYYAATSGSVSYRAYDDATNGFGSASTFSSAGTHLWAKVVGTEKAVNAVKAHACLSNSVFDVLCYRWTGSGAPASEQTITADTVDQTYLYWDLAFQDDSNHHLDIRHSWSGVPAGTTYTLKIKGYRVDENVNVEVLTPPSTWTSRITVSATTNTLYTYTLTSSEYNSGAPSIRFVDPTGADSAQSDFYVDYSLVMTDHTYTLVANSADNPTIMVRAPNDTTYGTDTGGLFWNPTASETYFFAFLSVPEYELVAIPILGIFLLVSWNRRRAALFVRQSQRLRKPGNKREGGA